ncbi:glycosyltransferase family 4 protein [Haliscomenobacter hydrossis]|uniref:Glycosyl transferase group 1 n=1 Tax=Haliscomenobacter hydrossis (strain ATCC 27775 / DSM 1100 / LMG 10767 / O) TaxID=760192 RepID=F4L445_HALH1|nr:glycosyltransferase family 4 protein [Haliscomenobacter hydrossis]AEE50743.1 glycosyl transferase group 1 [Haliscomenobacter hydrossis DSM 1100]
MTPPKVLFSTLAIHLHAQQIALALNEVNHLGQWQTEGLDFFPSKTGRFLRKNIQRYLHGLDQQLNKRHLQVELPAEVVHNTWTWELARTAVKQLRRYPLLEDWLWEKSEYALDSRAAYQLKNNAYQAYLGTEFGSLASIRTAKQLGKKSILIFTSPHHETRKKWLNLVHDTHAHAITAQQKKLIQKSFERDQRRDEEAHQADFIHTSSMFTRQSLIDAGIEGAKIQVVPLGGPLPVPKENIRVHNDKIVKFICIGNLALHKGTHLILEAWQKLKPKQAELHFYGHSMLNSTFLKNLESSIFIHGFTPPTQLQAIYMAADALVFPTLCDGFGMVISEALACGCPVITTTNAGGADYIQSSQNGFVIPPGDVAAIQEKISWCLDNRAKLGEMRQLAWESAHTHTWAHFRAKFQQDIQTWLA